MSTNVIPMVGKVIGKLKVIRSYDQAPSGLYQWECQCECGRMRVVLGTKLRNNLVTACHTCMRRNQIKYTSMGHTSTYTVWSQMMYRHRKDTQHPVCDRWLTYHNFLEDIGAKPDAYCYLKRIDRSKGFFKENCCWELYTTAKNKSLKQNQTIQLKIEPIENPMPENKIVENRSALETLKNIARNKEELITNKTQEINKQQEDLKFFREIIKQVEKELNNVQ